ncbi:MAG: hypothetical protein U1E38_01615 [Rhodospirillales bacterium]
MTATPPPVDDRCTCIRARPARRLQGLVRRPPLEFYTLSAKSEIDGEMTPRAGLAASGPIFAVAAVRVPQ